MKDGFSISKFLLPLIYDFTVKAHLVLVENVLSGFIIGGCEESSTKYVKRFCIHLMSTKYWFCWIAKGKDAFCG